MSGLTLTLFLALTSQFFSFSHTQEIYSKESEICCAGDVFPASTGNGCCGGLPYNTSQHLCCPQIGDDEDDDDDDDDKDNKPILVAFPVPDLRDKPRRRSSGQHFECCGKQAIDSERYFCCNGNPAPKTFPTSACCGQKVYDADRFICCGNATLFRRNGSVLTKGHLSQCCGDQGYDPKKFMCCDGKLISQWSSTTAKCCGSKAFDIGFQGCCGNQVYDDPFGIFGCCGDNLYDAFVGICCGDRVFPDPLRTKSCCGSQTYDYNNQSCCDSQHISSTPLASNESCCGDDTYNPHTHMCCNSTVVERLSKTSQCCGSSSYDKNREEECCGGHTVTLTSTFTVTGKQLNKRQNKNVLRCCRGEAVEVPINKELCC